MANGGLARNVLHLTLLYDDYESANHRDLFDVFHNFYIQSSTLELIRRQSEKLICVSESTDLWNAAYGDCLRMVNIETLNTLHHVWKHYCDPKNQTSKFSKKFKTAVQKVYNDTHKNNDSLNIACTCGGKCLFFPQIDDMKLSQCAKVFWENGMIDQQDVMRPTYCNPLFAYSQGAGSRFRVYPHLCPLYGYHLVTAITSLTPDSPFYQQQEGRGVLELTAEAAKMQFEAWNSSFRRAVREMKSKSQNIFRIRFFVGDAVAFSTALSRRRSGEAFDDIYSRPWSGRPLCLEDDGIPLSFNVIETGYLIDYVGLLNILPCVIPLLKQTASVLYTSAQVYNPKAESNLLERLLCGDVAIMCTLLGIAPTPYVTNTTTRFYHIDCPALENMEQPITNRISWRLIASDCPTANVAHSVPHCNPSEMAVFFYNVYRRMFPHEFLRPGQPDTENAEPTLFFDVLPCYTRRSFALLIKFVMNRVHDDWIGSGWDIFIKDLLNKISDLKNAMNRVDLWQGFYLQMRFCDIGVRKFPRLSKFSRHRNDRGIMKLETPPDVIACVVSIPRSKIQIIYDKVAAHVDVNISIVFLAYLWGKGEFNSIHPVFGKLIPDDDGLTGTIEEDKDGWYGSSDLHISFYLPTFLCLHKDIDPREAEIWIGLSPEINAVNIFEPIFGDCLEFFRARLFDETFVHLFKSLPGLAPPKASSSKCITQEFALETDTFMLHYPRFSFKKREFELLVPYIGDNQMKVLREKKGIGVTQTSPCTAVVICNGSQQICTFPFPVANIQYKVLPVLGSIQIIAPLVTNTNHGLYTSNPFPVIRSPNSTLCNFNLSYVNFAKLAKIDSVVDDSTWLNPHLFCMFSDRELTFRGIKDDLITNVKNAIHSMMLPRTRILRLKPSGNEFPLIFFFTGLYHDFNSHSIVADAYVLPVNADLESLQTTITAVNITVNDEGMKWWRSALPSMVERCRDWKHTTSCEYLSSLPVSFDKGKQSICSCGRGKVGREFSVVSAGTWNIFEPHVTRIAVAPLFAAAYVEPTRTLWNLMAEEKWEKMRILRYPEPIDDDTDIEALRSRCRVCWKEKGNKCKRCRQVSYCSKECQKNDWGEHKKHCKNTAT
jgi:hypothetical protein